MVSGTKAREPTRSREAKETDIEGSKVFPSPLCHKSKYISRVGGQLVFVFSRNYDPEFGAVGAYRVHLNKPLESRVLL